MSRYDARLRECSAWLALITMPLIGLVAVPAARAQGNDSVVVQIEQRIAAGDRAGAHALADSVLATLETSAPTYPQVLWWRASTATNAADAERDYRRLSIEFPLSPRAADALLNLAQLEYARRDRLMARRHFEQLLLEHAGGSQVAKANYWIARLSLDEGDTTHACSALVAARQTAPAADVELSNQIEYYSARCLTSVPHDTASARSDSTAATDSASTADLRRGYTIQVAAYPRRSEATALAAQLKRRGFPSRVAGTSAPFRVRIGRFPTPDAAAATLAQVKRTYPRAILVPAEPR